MSSRQPLTTKRKKKRQCRTKWPLDALSTVAASLFELRRKRGRIDALSRHVSLAVTLRKSRTCSAASQQTAWRCLLASCAWEYSDRREHHANLAVNPRIRAITHHRPAHPPQRHPAHLRLLTMPPPIRRKRHSLHQHLHLLLLGRRSPPAPAPRARTRRRAAGAGS